MKNRHVVATGFAVGLENLTNLKFKPNKPFRCCLICGAVFQTEIDRRFPNSILAQDDRRQWASSHAKQHPNHLHKELQRSGRFCTPEAAEKLQAFGIFSVNDLAVDDEVSDALRLSNAIPFNDSEE